MFKMSLMTRVLVVMLLAALYLLDFTAPIFAKDTQLPAKAVIHVVLMQALSSESSVIGQRVEAKVFQPLFYGENRLLTGEETLSGYVTQIAPAQPGQNGLIGFTFNQLNLSPNKSVAIKSTVIANNKNKLFFGGEGTLGTVATRYRYNSNRLMPYNRVLLQGSYNYGVSTEFKAGDIISIQLQEALELPLR